MKKFILFLALFGFCVSLQADRLIKEDTLTFVTNSFVVWSNANDHIAYLDNAWMAYPVPVTNNVKLYQIRGTLTNDIGGQVGPTNGNITIRKSYLRSGDFILYDGSNSTTSDWKYMGFSISSPN